MRAVWRKSRLRGFTLLEMLVVVLIIGLLTGVIAPRLVSQVARSEITTAKAQLSAIDKALTAFRIDVGRYPTTAEGLTALVISPVGESRWQGPYLQGAIPVDPWGQAYRYASPSATSATKNYDLYSLGRDRMPGGDGDAADIVQP